MIQLDDVDQEVLDGAPLRTILVARFLGYEPVLPLEFGAEYLDVVGWLAMRDVGRGIRPDAVDGAVRLYRAIEESPLPQEEWKALGALLDDGDLAALLGISASSVQRYKSGARPTPDDVADRLHVIALICADLIGSYNAFGVRRWFGRSRAALGGRSPADILSGDWASSDHAVGEVRRLARTLVVGPA